MSDDPKQQQEVIKPYELLTRSVSSGHGFSFYGGFRRCPYRVLLEAGGDPEALANGKPAHYKMPSRYAAVGILFAKLVELYYGGQYDKVVFEWQGDEELEAWQEAQRLFRLYRANFGSNEFQTVGVEVPYEFTGALALKHFGVVKHTGRIDWIVRVSQDAITDILQKRAILLPGPGIYLADHKVRWKASKNLLTELEYRMQFWGYMMAWNLAHPQEPCLGTIGNVTMAYVDNSKLPRFLSSFSPFPTETQQRAVRAYLMEADYIRANRGYPANPEECFRYESTPCEFHPSQGGTCDLIGLVKERI